MDKRLNTLNRILGNNAKMIIKVITFYGLWLFFWLCIVIYSNFFTPYGEAGISAHIWLTITGLPLSLLSWLTPHGSV
jgi:hypothetical protein